MPEQSPATLSRESPDAELARLRAENAALRAQLAQQAELIAQLLQRIQELEARLAKDSHNSSKPPSSDPPFKKPPPRSLRQRSGKKPGGQKDHPGTTRALVDTPEHTVIVPLSGTARVGVRGRGSPPRSCPSAAKWPIWWSAARSPSIAPWPGFAPVGRSSTSSSKFKAMML